METTDMTTTEATTEAPTLSVPTVEMAERLLAQTIAKRRDPEPIIIEVLAEKASQEGIIFHNGGAELYLVKTLPSQYLVFPLMPQEKLSTGGKGKSKESGKRPRPWEALIRAAPPVRRPIRPSWRLD